MRVKEDTGGVGTNTEDLAKRGASPSHISDTAGLRLHYNRSSTTGLRVGRQGAEMKGKCA